MRKIPAVLAALAVMSGSAYATLIASDDFSSYAAGSNIGGPNWNAKWQSGTDQQNLFQADAAGGGHGLIDTSVAWRNYRIIHQTSFTMGSGVSATIASDFRYNHNAGGNITSNVNKNAFGLNVSDQPQWWNGSNTTVSWGNRGGAIGNTLPVAPWVEGWQPHNSLGVDTVAGGMSHWLRIEWTLTDDGATIWGQATFTDLTTSATYDTTMVDLGLASGSTLYGGYSTDWNDVGDVPVESFSSFSEVQLDNFSIDVVPEPSTFALLGFASVLMVLRRKFVAS